MTMAGRGPNAVLEDLYLRTFKYTFGSVCTSLEYFLIAAGVLIVIPKYHAEYLYVLLFTCSCAVIANCEQQYYFVCWYLA